MRTIGLLIVTLLLSSCASQMMPIESVETITGGATTSLGYVADTSAIKELAVHKTLQNRDKMIRDTHKDSGMSIGWQVVQEVVFYPGMKEPITVSKYLPTISYKEKAEFNQQLPLTPSEHPGWRVAENLGKSIVQGTVLGLGFNAASDVLKTAIGNSGHNYSDSSVTTIDNSSNPIDNSVAPIDNSIGPVDNSVGPVDNSYRPVDNSIRGTDEDNQD